VQRFAEIWSRKKWLALAIFALAAAAGTTLTFSLPALYRSTATVIVEQGRSLVGATGELESRLQVISQEILSRSRLESLIQAEGLYPDLRRQASMEDAVNRMRSDIHTESKVQPQPSGIGSTIAFAISYRGADPETVARVANRLASFYLEQDRKIRERQTSGTVQVLKAQLDDVKQNLQEQERALGQFQDQHAAAGRPADGGRRAPSGRRPAQRPAEGAGRGRSGAGFGGDRRGRRLPGHAAGAEEGRAERPSQPLQRQVPGRHPSQGRGRRAREGAGPRGGGAALRPRRRLGPRGAASRRRSGDREPDHRAEIR